MDGHPRHLIQKNQSAKCNLPEAARGSVGVVKGTPAANAAGAAVTALQKDAILHSVTVTTSPATTPDPKGLVTSGETPKTRNPPTVREKLPIKVKKTVAAGVVIVRKTTPPRGMSNRPMTRR